MVFYRQQLKLKSRTFSFLHHFAPSLLLFLDFLSYLSFPMVCKWEKENKNHARDSSGRAHGVGSPRKKANATTGRASRRDSGHRKGRRCQGTPALGGGDPLGCHPAEPQGSPQEDVNWQGHRSWGPLQPTCLKWCLSGNWGQQEGRHLKTHHVITKLPTVFRQQLWLPSERADMHLFCYIIFGFRGFVLFL